MRILLSCLGLGLRIRRVLLSWHLGLGLKIRKVLLASLGSWGWRRHGQAVVVLENCLLD